MFFRNKFDTSPKFQMNGTTKQVVFGLINMQMFIATGVGRCYEAFLFYQLDLPDSTIHLSNDQKTWIASSMCLLTPLGCLVTGVLMDVFGRKICVQLIYIPLIISWILISLADSYGMLIIASLIQSTATGVGFSTLPYTSEISTPKYRGFLLSLVDAMENVGILTCNSMMYFLKWNTVSIIFVGISTFSFVLTLVLPESPVWLYSKGETERAVQILCYLRSKSADELEDEITDMKNSGSTEGEMFKMATLKNSLRAWKQFSIACAVFILVNFAGPVMFMSYTVLLFERLETSYDATDLAMLYTISGFIGSLLTPVFVHNAGRRVVLGATSAGMTIGMAIITAYEILFLESTEKPFPWIIPLLVIFITLCNNIGITPIACVIGGELFPLEVRGALQGAYGFVTCLHWAFTLKYYPIILFDYGVTAMFGCFAVFSFILFLYAVFILPETSGKTLNEVQEQYFPNKRKTGKSNTSTL